MGWPEVPCSRRLQGSTRRDRRSLRRDGLARRSRCPETDAVEDADTLVDERGRRVLVTAGVEERQANRDRLAHVGEEGWLFSQIADQVAERRRELSLSQHELAALTGTTQSAIARLESGQRPPRIDTLLRIANAFETELVVELRPRS